MNYTALSKTIDRMLTPPPNYANFRLSHRIGYHWRRTLVGPSRLRNATNWLRFVVIGVTSIMLFPVAAALRRAGFRFVNIDFAQIGSISYLDMLIRDDLISQKTDRHRFLVSASKYHDANNYIMNLYDGLVTFVRSPLMKLMCLPFFVSRVFEKDTSFRFDGILYTEVVAHKSWNSYRDTYKSPLISLPAIAELQCRAELDRYLPNLEKFVSLHVRDSGFYSDASRDTRNADIRTYAKAIRYLIDQGYAVIRMGSEKAKPVDQMVQQLGPMFFDYAHSPIRSERMDAFLFSKCEFFIGTASGPAAVPMLFGVNVCNVNWYNAAHARHFERGDLTTFKRFRYAASGELVPFGAIIQKPFSANPSRAELKQLGVLCEDNTEDEILETVQEFLSQPKHPTPLQLAANRQMTPLHYAYEASGQFSNVSLKPYEAELIEKGL